MADGMCDDCGYGFCSTQTEKLIVVDDREVCSGCHEYNESNARHEARMLDIDRQHRARMASIRGGDERQGGE